MPINALSLKINSPAETIPFGRGFYQLEEESLYLPLEYQNQKTRFFSHLESDFITLHIDQKGRLMFIELDLPRRRWIYEKDLTPPEQVKPADIRFLDFRNNFDKPKIFCNKTREEILIQFLATPAKNNYSISENLIAQTDSNDRLVAIWVSNIIDDIAGREISNWRKSIHDKPTGLSSNQIRFQKNI